MNPQNPQLILRKYPAGNWVIGVLFLALAASYLPDRAWSAGAFNFILLVVEVGMGLFLILSGTVLNIRADRITRMLTVSFQSAFRGSKTEIPFAEIAAIQLEMNPSRDQGSRGAPTYRIVAIRKDGQSVPFYFYFSSRSTDKNRIVEKLRAFIGVGGEDTVSGGGFQAVSQIATQPVQEQQETITGSEAEEHITDGVHWTLETRAFGGMPVSRWQSPDFKCEGSFLYLTQINKDQSTKGGFMAAMGKMVDQTSMSLFGFSDDLTPNENHAEVLAPLNPQLENSFAAFTSDASRARQILNPWAIQALAAWARSHPLMKNHRDQLAVLFSPKGLYLATMGLLNPEFLDEMAKLGAELVKAQGGLP